PGGCELVVVATPARFLDAWLEKLGQLAYDGVVTDVASTKGGVMRAARRHLGSAARFGGGHPMAGSERSGVGAARHDLFEGAYWLLTPGSETDPDAFSRVHAFVTALGARVISVEPKSHDEAVAIVSHVPHVAAAALCDVAGAHAGESRELLRLAAGGFKDTTRIAAGSPELWTGICLDNADALADGLRELRLALGEFEAMVRGRDGESIRGWLTGAADVRKSLPAQWVPATTKLTELKVPMMDRPGVVAEVTAAVSSAGCNIEGIDIDHETEDRALLVLVLTDEGDFSALAEDLADRGFEPRFEPLAEAAEEEASE
ncbi:MAG TPA: prephenate dehydrogenase/arogenate dehydrogenase family protein, partial [Coriobacteriia bacterium]|nr:prephenate dehydrogenase/arogenate dehydrogenase family protein [Coriobacteriia bacterium]